MEKLTDALISVISDGISKKIESGKKDHEWKKLFLDTGIFFVKSSDKFSSFENDLCSAFSKDNLNKISDKLRNEQGYELPELLYDEIYGLLVRYEIPVREAESYSHHFVEVVINYINSHDSNKSHEIFWSECHKEEEKLFEKHDKSLNEYDEKLKLILVQLNELGKTKIISYSLADIDASIRKNSLYGGMNLDFFQVDDEQFESEFQSQIENKCIFVVGKSKEETTYRILNELKNNYTKKNVMIIKSESEWAKLEQVDVTGNVLIPFFYAESIVAIPKNTNIFVYSEDEPCYDNNKIVLHKRTRSNIAKALEAIGMGLDEAYKLVESTHGLYIPMKKSLFELAIHNKPIWEKNHSGTVISALLCGKWTESEGDTLVFGELSGVEYEKSKSELEEYINSENPYVVEIDDHMGRSMQLACVEDAWEELDRFITDDSIIWKKFIDLLYEVLIESEPIFDYPFDKYFEACVYAKKPEWSPTLKHGMIRTLIMYADYRGHIECQRQIDNVVRGILDTITNTKRWGYISQYLTDLCEASPKAVIEKLEDELTNPQGMKELFEVNDGDALMGMHYYTNILWAVEQLIQQKIYVKRAVKWLWKINEYKIKYSISNSPGSLLKLFFCAWLNECAVSVNEKIELARDAVDKYSSAWKIISSELPNGSSTILSSLCKPQYREINEPDTLYMDDVNKTYIEYLRICVTAAENDAERWIIIVDHLQHYDEKIQLKVLDELVSDSQEMTDAEKQLIKSKIRDVIYRHRFFVDAKWSMNDSTLKKYEHLLSIIVATLSV